MTKYLTGLLVTLIVLSCNRSGQPVSTDNISSQQVKIPYFVDIEKSQNKPLQVALSQIGKEIDYIPLETSPESLLRRVTQIVFSDYYIFISDFNRLLQFDRKGKFIRQIGSNGRGPAEYVYVMGFCTDDKNEIIYIIDYANHLVKEFDFNGDFIKHIRLPFEAPQLLRKDSTSLIFNLYNGTMTDEDSAFNLYITDTLGNPEIKIKKRLIRKAEHGLAVAGTPLYFYNDSLRFLEFGVDTLFTLKRDSLKSYAVFNLGKLKMDPDLNTSSDQDYTLASRKLFIHNVLEDKRFMYLKLDYGLTDSSQFIIFNKFLNETTVLRDKSFFNDLDGGPEFWPKYIYKDSILVGYIDSYKLLKLIHNYKSGDLAEKDQMLFNRLEVGLTETSNPVLMVLR